MLHKTSKVEFHPLGVVGAIVSWNYPFHNLFNPVLAAVFSGNGIVVKVFDYGIKNLLTVVVFTFSRMSISASPILHVLFPILCVFPIVCFDQFLSRTFLNIPSIGDR